MAKRRTNARSLAARKGWATRRAIVRQRSERAKRGWNTRRKNERKRKKKRGGGGGPGGLREFLVAFKYKKRGAMRMLDFLVSAKSEDGIEDKVNEYMENHESLEWAVNLEWSDVNIIERGSSPVSRARVRLR
jgi:hypothetical protein